MSATITAGTYVPATHTLPVTVTGGDAGSLEVWREHTDPTGVRWCQQLHADPDYDGGGVIVTDYWPVHGEQSWHVFVGGVRDDTDTATVTMQADWLLSLDPASGTSRVVCRVNDGDGWSRRRRGWWGTIVGTRRTVALVDVALGPAEGTMVVWCADAAARDALLALLDQGVAVARSPRTRVPQWPFMADEVAVLPVGGGEDGAHRVEVRWVETWPVGTTEVLPDEEEFV